MLSDIGQVVNAAEIIAGEKPVTDLGVTAVDDKTLEVQLNVPVSYFLSLMYFPTFYPVNEAFYNTCADTFGTSPETVLSNGAFVLTDYQPAATAFALEKNPDYYDADKIALDGLAYQVIKDSQQALMSYQTGTLDITLLNGEQVDQVKDDPEFTSVGAGYLWYISPNIDAVPDLANLMLHSLTASLDVAHAMHPNHPEKNDPTNPIPMEGGVVIKMNYNQRYATDTNAVSIVEGICRAEKIAHTKFVNHGDVVGGGTLGSILSTSIPAMTVDLGVPILAMHSSRELMARSSQLAMDQFAEAFFK